MFTITPDPAGKPGKTLHWSAMSASLLAVLLVMAVLGVSMAEENPGMPPPHRPKDYILTFDAQSSKIIGPAMVRQITDFFDYADNAIKTKDMNALSFLYSERYADGNHRKADVLLVWKRLFDDFDDLSMTHNLRFITTDPNSNVMIVQCSGILMGKAKQEKGLQALDHWMNMNHVLIKEDKGWKIIGTVGREDKRFWFDKPLHPLF